MGSPDDAAVGSRRMDPRPVSQGGRRRRQRRLAAGGVVAVILVAVWSLVGRDLPGTMNEPAATFAPALPAGWQEITVAEASFGVPDDWSVKSVAPEQARCPEPFLGADDGSGGPREVHLVTAGVAEQPGGCAVYDAINQAPGVVAWPLDDAAPNVTIGLEPGEPVNGFTTLRGAMPTDSVELYEPGEATAVRIPDLGIQLELGGPPYEGPDRDAAIRATVTRIGTPRADADDR